MNANQRKRAKLAKRIKNLLKQKAWTQQDLADKSGFPKSYISGILHCNHNPTLETLVQLEDTLGEVLVSIPVE